VALALLFTGIGQAEPAKEGGPADQTLAAADGTLHALKSFLKVREGLQRDITALNQQIDVADSEAEKGVLRQEREKLEGDLRTLKRNFENIAAGVDISALQEQASEEFSLQREVFALLKPAIDEMKEMTAHVRQKSELRDEIAYLQERLPVIEQALANVRSLRQRSAGELIEAPLRTTEENWQKEYDLMQSKLQAAQLKLDKLLASETSLAEASQSYLKSFFQRRGLYIAEAVLVVLGVILASRLSRAGLQRYVPGFRRQHRSFRIRLVELIHRLVTGLLLILGPMAVFYVVEDWVLFSLGILLLLGIAWTLRQTLPRYWHQVQIFLNVGSVREGERIAFEGLPWLVQEINIFGTLVNPVAEISQRVHIADLVDLKSRPSSTGEPWFPCRRGDWVILADGVRGKVISVSHELVQLVERGGAQLTYTTEDFLAKSPRNLATNFRIKETLGVSYALQRESTTTIPEILHEFVLRRAEQEGYAETLLNLRVEFAQAGNSSLDLVVIADFDGQLGDLYNRLRRSVQRWCVDACTEHGWEIPFPQLTLHGKLNGAVGG
jgi:hypothetical protein